MGQLATTMSAQGCEPVSDFDDILGALDCVIKEAQVDYYGDFIEMRCRLEYILNAVEEGVPDDQITEG